MTLFRIMDLHLLFTVLYCLYTMRNVHAALPPTKDIKLPTCSVCQCKNEEINCRKVGFSKITAIINLDKTALMRLTNLNLGDNKIINIPHNAFSSLTNLQKLYLYGNKISNIHINAFNVLSKLTVLQLENNKLKHIPIDVFNGVPTTAKIYLSANQLTCECELYSKLLVRNFTNVNGICTSKPSSVCNHGTCYKVNSTSYNCSCNEGFSGTFCNTIVDTSMVLNKLDEVSVLYSVDTIYF